MRYVDLMGGQRPHLLTGVVSSAMLREEPYALDGDERAAHPYVVTEQDDLILIADYSVDLAVR